MSRIIKKRPQIIFKNLEMDGEKDQERWLKILDLLEEIYPDITQEQSDTELFIKDCYVHDFFFTHKDLAKENLRRNFAYRILAASTGEYTGSRRSRQK